MMGSTKTIVMAKGWSTKALADGAEVNTDLGIWIPGTQDYKGPLGENRRAFVVEPIVLAEYEQEYLSNPYAKELHTAKEP